MNESAPHPPQTRLAPLRRALAGLLTFAAGMAAALLALLIYSALRPPPEQLTARDVRETVAQAMASATPEPALSAQVYHIIQPSFVLVQTEDTSSGYGIGSGVVINAQGAILTSLHVVAGAAAITVTFADGTEAPAQIIASQAENDIAVLSASQLPAQVIPATLGNGRAMQVGDEVFALGNPYGLYGSLSAGVVSGFDRAFHPQGSDQELDGLIQIDAAVNPGNSGGPLLNRQGQVVGIVVGIISPKEQDGFIGIGFAVPIEVAGQAAGLPEH